ncbi:RNA polymerase recycling motor HelD [Gracilibacillus lacisalsi]|uniref:RNA polymerase recycling motor HelD n=1 Tax=Gracilibacillus lacisalsi TaxID=393087 RepID=UPI0003687EEC|nr:RNA polymerase recycling motor HelD [Gracilibacillus lacisalsi]
MVKAIKHIDYKEELYHLNYTKDYMQSVLDIAYSSQNQFQENIKDAYINLDYLDSSLSYINILTNSRLLDMIQGDLEQLNKMKNAPYFGRIDFHPDHSNHNEIYYIGKFSLYRKDNQEPIIVDWRSPVANLYYDGRLGEVTYHAEEGERTGVISLKRQYQIENGNLEEINDIDVTSRDELLQQSLSKKSDKRLNDIVATIQEEQNSVIRQDLQKPMIVQGVAGSGKTTIALHRLSYFLYHYQDKMSPDKVMILAPNKMFIDYIAQSLPELGVDKIRQSTFVEYVQECIGTQIPIINPNNKLKELIENQDRNREKTENISKIKGSVEFEKLIKNYLKEIIRKYVPKEDLYISKYKFFSYKKIQKLFLKDYCYLTIDQRKEKISQLLKKEFKKKKDDLLSKIEEKFEEKFEKIQFKYKDGEQRRSKTVALLNNKEKVIKEIKSETLRNVNKYMNKFPKKNATEYYKNLLCNEKLLKKYAEEILNPEEISLLFNQSQLTINKGEFEIEDLAAILFIQAKLFGVKDELKMKYIVIDEAQDYSLFQFRALSVANQTKLFTILGDLAQGIHQYRGIDNWKDIQSDLLTKSNYITLQKSYRTTIEIMELANEILKNQSAKLPLAEPVVRHGLKPTLIIEKTKSILLNKLENLVNQLVDETHSLIAMITKNDKEAEELYRFFKQKTDSSIQLLTETDAIKEKITIVPASLAKGLEFDVVILVNMESKYHYNDLESKLLYVAMTRAMHQLYLIGNDISAFQLEAIDPKYYSDK